MDHHQDDTDANMQTSSSSRGGPAPRATDMIDDTEVQEEAPDIVAMNKAVSDLIRSHGSPHEKIVLQSLKYAGHKYTRDQIRKWKRMFGKHEQAEEIDAERWFGIMRVISPLA